MGHFAESECIVNRIHVVRAMAFFIAGRNS